MQLYTINATPLQTQLQYQNSLKGAMPSGKVLNKSEVRRFNDIALAEYPEKVAEILSKHGIDGFTMYQVMGYWKGVPEISFKIEIATELSYFMIGELCNELRDTYNQEAVMVTKPDNTVDFI